MIKSHRTPETICPFCNKVLDAATGPDHRSPSPGDISICIYCHTWLMFNDDITLRPVNEEDLKKLGPESVALLKHLTEQLDTILRS